MKLRVASTRGIRGVLLGAAVACATPAGAVETATLLSPTPSAGAEMAYAVGIEGTDIVIGAPGENEVAGAIYVTDCATLPCATPLRIAPDDLAAGDAFGTAVALSGDTLIASALGPDPGSVYVYVRNGGGWTEQAQLTPSGGGAGEHFGISASISGDRIAVGADRANGDAGAVYVFVRSGSAWTQDARLTATGASSNDALGSSVALDDDTLLAGAPFRHGAGSGSYAHGAVYAFVHGGGGWTQQATLIAAAGANGDLFGMSVDVAGDRAIVGAPFAASAVGTAYVFQRSGSVWAQQTQLNASGGAAGDEFGWSVALGDDSAFVGAPFAGIAAEAPCGGAYAFDGAALAQSSSGSIESPMAGELAGWAVAASGPRWVVSAPGHVSEDIEHAGAAYWFDGAVTIFHAGFDVSGACVGQEDDPKA